jgi:Tol biopolymer transport system component
MGEVFRARDPRLGRDVAIKALPAEFSSDPERLGRFEREARLLASLSHPNIAGIHGLEEVDGARYLVLEIVEGETLADRLARGPLPLDEAIEVGRQIAAGLEAAHENGIVHRDLKPGNVMLTPSGAAKVLDFGLAKAGAPAGSAPDLNLSASPTLTRAATQAGVILGTAAYMSPEQARGRAVDKRTDIWSFGCVLYECLTGRPAFEGETVSDLIAHILKTEPDQGALPAGTPPHVRRLVSRCLRKDARERLRDIGEARIALAAGTEAEGPVAAARTAGGARGGRGLPWWATAAAVLVVGVVAVIATLRFGRTTGPHPVRKFDLIAQDMVVDWPIAPRLSPDGSRLAYVAQNQIWVRDLVELVPRPVAALADAGPIAWSSDSREIVYSDGGKLLKVAAQGGQPIAICKIPGTGKIIGAAWSSRGTIAFSVWRDRMYRVDAGGGNPSILIDLDPATQIDFHAPSWLPDGGLLYVTHWKAEDDVAGTSKPGITIFDGEKQIPVPGGPGYDDAAPELTDSGQLLYLKAGAAPGIWAVSFDLKERRPIGAPVLVAPDAVTLSAAADGSLLYVEGARTSALRELVWLDRRGQKIEAIGAPHAQLNHPRLSPDGKRVAFGASDGGNDDVWVLDLATGHETRITFDPQAEVAPEWLGSSTRLAYLVEPGDMQAAVQAINADGSGAQRPFAPMAPAGPPLVNVSLAPDGKSAIRVIDQRGHEGLQIGSVLADGTLGPLKPVFSQGPEPNIGDARISPGGELLAYQTNDPGQVDVFLTRFPSGEGQWQVGTGGGFKPRWARDSRELFLIAGSGPTRREMAVAAVDPSRDPPLGAVTRLFDLRGDDDGYDYDVAPDGRRLLFTRASGGGEGAARHLVLVQHWQSEIDATSRP